MFTITKSFTFDAAHHLPHLRPSYPDHPCARVHGHTFVVEFELQAPGLNENHFVRDYGELKLVKEFIDTYFDHRDLNEILLEVECGTENEERHLAIHSEMRNRGICPPPAITAECMANFLFHWFKVEFSELVAVRWKETPKTCAEYRPSDAGVWV